MRWRWPPESMLPLWPMRVWMPSGMRAMNSIALAASAAAMISASLAPASSPYAMLLATVSSNSTTDWPTQAICRRSEASV